MAETILNSEVPSFQIQNQTIVDGLWALVRGPVRFGFGLEEVLKRKFSDPGIPNPRFTLELKKKTVREILDALCAADRRFTWSMEGGIVNVFPRAVVNNPTYLLNRRLEKLELKGATDVQNGLLAIVRQLPPPVEQTAQAQAGGDDPYPPEPWTVTFRDVTVRQVINRLAAHGGPCGIWIFGGSEDFRSLGFFNTCPGVKRPVPVAGALAAPTP